MLIQYLRDKNGKRTGVVVSTSRNSIGYSLCSPKDRWNNELGKKIAAGRSETWLPAPDWRVILLSKDDHLEINFDDYYWGRYDQKYDQKLPQFRFVDGGPSYYMTIPRNLIWALCQMYERSQKYFKEN